MRINNLAEQFITGDLIKKLNPQSWLDVGIGEGLVAAEWRVLQDIEKKIGIDPYTDPDHPEKQLGQHCGGRWQIIQESYDDKCSVWNDKFDVYTLMDVVEHYEKEEGLKILDHIEAQNPKLIVVWTPDGFYPSDHHKSGWAKEDFEKRGYTVEIAQDFHLGPPQKANGILAYKIAEDKATPISIIIPTRLKNKPYLDKCIESLKKHQTVEHEYLIIENGEGTLRPQGQCNAVNEGVERAVNEIVMVINDDMIARADWEKLISLVEEHKVISPNLVEPQAGAPPFILHDCGKPIENFQEDTFTNFVNPDDNIENGFNLPYLTTKTLFKLVEGYDRDYDPWGSNSDSDLEYKFMLAGVKPKRYRGIVFYHFSNISGTFTLPEAQPYWRGNTVHFERKWGIVRAGSPAIWYCDFTIDANKLIYRPEWAKLENNPHIIYG